MGRLVVRASAVVYLQSDKTGPKTNFQLQLARLLRNLGYNVFHLAGLVYSNVRVLYSINRLEWTKKG
jgi:hypothetical protein